MHRLNDTHSRSLTQCFTPVICNLRKQADAVLEEEWEEKDNFQELLNPIISPKAYGIARIVILDESHDDNQQNF